METLKALLFWLLVLFICWVAGLGICFWWHATDRIDSDPDPDPIELELQELKQKLAAVADGQESRQQWVAGLPETCWWK